MNEDKRIQMKVVERIKLTERKQHLSVQRINDFAKTEC